jgi:hypothetical protein
MSKRIAVADRPRYVLYFRGHRPPDVHPRTWVPVLFDPAAAKALVLRFCGNGPLERFHNVITLPDGMTLSSEQLDEIMAADEAGVELNPEYARNVLRFKLGSWEEDHSAATTEVEEVTEDGEVVTIKVKKAKPEKPKRPTKPDNYITIGELCEKWNIKPLHARTALRASDLVKPDYGWAFDPKDVPKIKKICGVK